VILSTSAAGLGLSEHAKQRSPQSLEGILLIVLAEVVHKIIYKGITTHLKAYIETTNANRFENLRLAKSQ
jgi:hypothetical protein